MTYESDYLTDLEQIENDVRRLLSKEHTNNLTKILRLIEAEKCLEIEAQTDADEVRRSDEEDYNSREPIPSYIKHGVNFLNSIKKVEGE